MSKRVKANLQKVTLNIREGDWEYLESLAKPQGIATSEVVRMLISTYVDKKRANEPKIDHTSIEVNL